MRGIAKCSFLHRGINYKQGGAVDLAESHLAALARAGLVELVEEPALVGDTPPDKPAPEKPKKPRIEKSVTG